MSHITLKPQAKKAVLIGGMCSIAYLAVYLARNILGTVAPQMEEQGAITHEQFGYLTSIFFATYAVGQLINGVIGDKVKAKYMISMGLALAGVCNIVFAVFSDFPMATYCAYGMTGFFLAMIYGPMTKVVAENTEPIYATRCSLGYTFASFFGSPLAGVFAFFLAWQGVFAVSSAILLLMGAVCFTVFHSFERKGIIKYNQYKKPKEQKGLLGSVKVLIRYRIITFTLVSVITGIIRIALVQWLTVYFSDGLHYTSDEAAMIYTVSTLVISASAFVAIFVYERLGRNMDLTIRLAFIFATLFFAAVYFIHQPVFNIIFMVLAILSSNCAASMLWSRYCPSLRDTGMVSGATGYLDFMNYIAAAIASPMFSKIIDMGWNYLILICFGLMVAGIIVALPYNKWKKVTNCE